MNYYPHHIGDFNSSTRFNSRLERSVYRDMLDLYYDTEKPLPLELPSLVKKIAGRNASDEEVAAIEAVLEEFFHRTDLGWVNYRCQREIQDYHDGLEKSSAGGKARAAKLRAEAEAQSRADAAAAARQAALDLNPAASSGGDDVRGAFVVDKSSTEAHTRTDSEQCKNENGTCVHPSGMCAHGTRMCEQGARTMPARASTVREGANQNQNQARPTPTLIEVSTRGATALELSIALRERGIKCQPADPRLIAMAEQGISVATALSAHADAALSKPGQEIPLGYLVKILERRAAEAANMRVAGANARASPRTGESAKDRARRETLAEITGIHSDDHQSRIIDITPMASQLGA